MRSVLIGPGAIGGTVATLVTNGGFQLDVVCRDEEQAKSYSNEGFHLTGVKGEHTVKLSAFPSVESLSGKYDIVMIATKVHYLTEIAAKMLPYLADDGIVVCMQNGICVDMLAEVVGEKRTCGCMIGFGATMKSKGNVEMTSLGEFIIGMDKGITSPKVDYLKQMLECVLPTKITDNIVGALFSKLIINSCINSLGAATGCTLGQVLEEDKACDIFLCIAREGIRVANKMGITVPPYNGILEYKMLLANESKPYNAMLKALFKKVGTKNYGDVKVSMLQSLERGEKTEVDIFNGFIAEKGRLVGVATPVNEQMTAIIKELESGKRKSGIKNLEDVVI